MAINSIIIYQLNSSKVNIKLFALITGAYPVLADLAKYLLDNEWNVILLARSVKKWKITSLYNNIKTRYSH